jgi:hypothetical protein
LIVSRHYDSTMTRFRVDTPERNYCIAHADTCAIKNARAENCTI